MVTRIYITYDDSEAITYSFLKQFFLMTGVWVTGKKMENIEVNDMEKGEMKYIHLYLVSKKNLNIIKERRVRDNVFYLTKHIFYNDEIYKNRKDILIYNWNNKTTFVDALNKIEEFKSESYGDLLKIYMKCNLWMVSWIYFEIAYEEKTEWSDWIFENCQKTINELHKSVKLGNIGNNIWKYKFMHLYCEFLMAAIEKQNGGYINVEKFLNSARELADIIGWQMALCNLCALISALSPLENKIALIYYKEILVYEESSEVLYKIGKIYEKNYGNIDMAVNYYKQATEINEYYRAEYKIASYHEQKGDWKQAIHLYDKIYIYLIERLMSNSYYSITVCDVEYLMKTLAKIRNIYKQKVAYNGNGFDKIFTNVRGKMITYSRLKNMVHCMHIISNKKSLKPIVDKNNTLKTNKQIEEEILRSIVSYVQRKIDLYI